MVESSTKKIMTSTERTKLSEIEPGANKTIIADNLTTDDSARVLSAKMGKKLNDEKFDKTGGVIYGDLEVDGNKIKFKGLTLFEWVE